MTFFIYRNSTLEPLFTDFEVNFSGYGDITSLNKEVDYDVWFYLLDIKSDIDVLVNEIED